MKCFKFLKQKVIWQWSIASFILIVIGLLGADWYTSYKVQDRIFTNIAQLPAAETAVVLGTAKYSRKGVVNLFYQHRLSAAFSLFKQGKVKQILVSGDNKTAYYNEPKLMMQDLKKMGVPESAIRQDFAGYRTFDSVIRASRVFHLEPMILVSQAFHCERALFIAQYHHINAVCFEAEYPQGQIKVRLREIFARVGMFYDLLMNNQPETFEQVQEKVPTKLQENIKK